MYIRCLSTVLIAFLAIGTTERIARGAEPPPAIPPEESLPDEQIVVYSIHDVPTDPTSDVVFVIELDVTAIDSDFNSVAWEITVAEFRQPGSGGDPDTVWVKNAPPVDTPDGLWWVEHFDPSAPHISEFDMLPGMVGMATAQDPANADLDYDVLGAEYIAPPSSPYENTTALSYWLAAVQDPPPQEPIEEGDGESVPIDDGVNDPG